MSCICCCRNRLYEKCVAGRSYWTIVGYSSKIDHCAFIGRASVDNDENILPLKYAESCIATDKGLVRPDDTISRSCKGCRNSSYLLTLDERLYRRVREETDRKSSAVVAQFYITWLDAEQLAIENIIQTSLTFARSLYAIGRDECGIVI